MLSNASGGRVEVVRDSARPQVQMPVQQRLARLVSLQAHTEAGLQHGGLGAHNAPVRGRDRTLAGPVREEGMTAQRPTNSRPQGDGSARGELGRRTRGGTRACAETGVFPAACSARQAFTSSAVVMTGAARTAPAHRTMARIFRTATRPRLHQGEAPTRLCSSLVWERDVGALGPRTGAWMHRLA